MHGVMTEKQFINKLSESNYSWFEYFIGRLSEKELNELQDGVVKNTIKQYLKCHKETEKILKESGYKVD